MTGNLNKRTVIDNDIKFSRVALESIKALDIVLNGRTHKREIIFLSNEAPRFISESTRIVQPDAIAMIDTSIFRAAGVIGDKLRGNNRVRQTLDDAFNFPAKDFLRDIEPRPIIRADILLPHLTERNEYRAHSEMDESISREREPKKLFFSS